MKDGVLKTLKSHPNANSNPKPTLALIFNVTTELTFWTVLETYDIVDPLSSSQYIIVPGDVL